MSAIASWWRAFKARLDEFNFGPPIEDDDDASIDHVNWKLLEDSFRRAACVPPEIEPKE